MKAPAGRQHPDSFRRIALWGGGFAVTFGILGLLGWSLGLPVLTSLHQNYIPIASSTCIIFIVQGTILIMHARCPSRARQWFFILLVAATSLFGILAFIGYFLGSNLDIEGLFFSSTESLGLFPTNRMSPLTGVLFFMSGTSLLLYLARHREEAPLVHFAGGLAGLVAMAGLVGTLSYIYGTPLLYRSTIIPMALTTCMAFLFLGAGLIAVAGPTGFFLKPLTGHPVLAMLLKTFVPLAFISVIGSDIVQHFVTRLNSALVAAASAVFFGMVAAAVAAHAARVIGGAIEKAEAERERSEKALRESEQRFQAVFDNARDGILLADIETKEFHMGNRAICEMLGYGWDELKSLTVHDIHPEQDFPQIMSQFEKQAKGEVKLSHDIPTRRKDGSIFHVDINAITIQLNGNKYLLGVFRDITDRKESEEALRLSLQFLEIVHRHVEITPLLTEFVSKIKDYTGCDAVGIRMLDEDMNIPYQAYEGFSQRFYESENPLSIKSDQCMCINVIKGDVNTNLPFFTDGGSFYINGTTRFLATVSEEDKGQTRNVCNREGYESVALVPFRRGDQMLGLIHVADHRENMVPLKVVKMLEKAAMQVGMAFQRVRAEDELRESEERFRSIFEDSPVGMGIAELDGRQLRANRAFCEMLGYSEDELLRMRISEFTHPEDRNSNREGLRSLTSGEIGALHFERRFLRKDEGIIWGSVHASVIRDESEKPMFLVGQVLDITERKETQEKIEHLNHVLRAIRDVNQLIVQEKDPNRLIQQTCRLLVETRGCRCALIILTDGAGVPQTYAEAGVGLAFQPLAEELREGKLPPCCSKARSHEGLLLIPDSSNLCHSCQITTHCPPGKSMCIRLEHRERIFGYVAVSVPQGRHPDEEEQSLFVEMAGDVAFALHSIEREEEARRAEEERLHAEAQLRQSQKMEALGTLAGGIAHDFNNILGIIVGYTEMARYEIAEASPVRSNMEEVLKATNRAKDLVQQILAFSRRTEQEMKPVQVGLIVKEAMKMLRSSLPSTIEVKWDVTAKSITLADPTQIHQVLMNLCTNAAHAMRNDGGLLHVSLTDVHFDSEALPPHSSLRPGPHVKLTVEDTGHGINPAIIDRIFDPFFTTKGPGDGTGLGLAVVHGIVESHGGAIEVDSFPGRGTAFHVILPARANASIIQGEEAAPLPGGNERILVVDDEPALAMIEKRMLERLGYKVESLTSSPEVVEAFRSQSPGNPFDLVITDMTMPHLTGTDLARELRRLQPDLPIVLCTGFSEKINGGKTEDLGVQGLIMKPVDLRELAGLVRKVLDEKPT